MSSRAFQCSINNSMQHWKSIVVPQGVSDKQAQGTYWNNTYIGRSALLQQWYNFLRELFFGTR